jgi:predicted aconitase with swiveling domain
MAAVLQPFEGVRVSAPLLQGMGLVEGCVEGPVAASDLPVGVARIDPESGILHETGHPLDGRNLAGTVLICPTGKGSSSGSYVLLNLARRGLAPAAIVATQADAVLIAGAVLADIPLITGCDKDALQCVADRTLVRVDGTAGTISLI